MSEVRTDEQIVTDVDEWLDDSTPHRVCIPCATGPCTPGALQIACCGVLYRLRVGRIREPLPNTCKACLSTPCSKCGNRE